MLRADVVPVTPEVTGPIEAVHVSDNQWVKRGGILFTIDPTPFRLQLRQAIAREAEARAQLPVDKAAIESLGAQKEAADEAAQLATTNLGRVTPLTKMGFASQQRYDHTLTAQKQSLSQQRSAKATLEKANQTLQLHQVAVATAHAARLYAEWRLSRTEVTAPVDGQVSNLTLAGGDYVSFGSTMSRYAYAWVFFGITAGLIMTEALSAPDNVLHFAATRVAEIIVGTASCILVAWPFSASRREAQTGAAIIANQEHNRAWLLEY